MRLRARVVKLVILVLLASIAMLGGVAVELYRFLHAPLKIDSQGLRYLVRPGTTLSMLAQDLAKRDVLSRPRYLVWAARWQGKDKRVQAGEYEIPPGTTPQQLLDRINGGRVLQHGLTLVEGWTFRQVLQSLNAQDTLEHTLTGLSEQEIMVRLGWPDQHPEGRFFPDTYYFTRSSTDAALLQRAYHAMDAILQAQWEVRAPDLPLKSRYEALILASIIEKETALVEERPMIAGVFIRRLRLEMPLETDPTVIYGLGASFDGNLRRTDLSRDTAYNTYLHRGLPPTPIAIPGVGLLWAALHPAEGKALYFVARGDGSHVFSDTLEQHNRAVARFQLHRTPYFSPNSSPNSPNS